MFIMTPQMTDSPKNETERNQAWLEQEFETMWSRHFSDVSRPNRLTVKWGRVSRTRLGAITARGGDIYHNPEVSEIRLNPLLQSSNVPVEVIWQTMAHEATHYCHGFCSPHPRKYRHPHKGNVIVKEFMARDLLAIHNKSHQWLKMHWQTYVTSSVPTKPKRKRRTYARKNNLSLLSNWHRRFTRRRRLGE
jgi:hypothetical protein